jgi:hypothetical protein
VSNIHACHRMGIRVLLHCFFCKACTAVRVTVIPAVGYFAACSCGWRSPETGQVSLMLRQVKDHLDAVRQARGGRPSTRAPARDQRGRDTSQGEILAQYESAREVRASVQGQQMRLSQSLRHSTDLLSASAEQADRLVAALERRQWATAAATAQSAESVRHKVERARELRTAIAAAAAALAVMAEEIAWIHQDPETRHRSGSSAYQRLVGVTSETAGTAREETTGTVGEASGVLATDLGVALGYRSARLARAAVPDPLLTAVSDIQPSASSPRTAGSTKLVLPPRWSSPAPRWPSKSRMHLAESLRRRGTLGAEPRLPAIMLC